MLLNFLDELRAAGIPVGIKEHLVLLEALDREAIARRPEEFYYLARATFVKDEGLLDRFDQVFAKVFRGIESSYGVAEADIPEDRSEEHTSELQSLMRISYAVFGLKKKKKRNKYDIYNNI